MYITRSCFFEANLLTYWIKSIKKYTNYLCSEYKSNFTYTFILFSIISINTFKYLFMITLIGIKHLIFRVHIYFLYFGVYKVSIIGIFCMLHFELKEKRGMKYQIFCWILSSFETVNDTKMSSCLHYSFIILFWGFCIWWCQWELFSTILYGQWINYISLYSVFV